MSDEDLWRDGVSIFRPSYSATWLNCEGALRPSQYATDTAGEDAAVGTVFHSLMAEWVSTGERPDHWLGKVDRIYSDITQTQFFDVEVDDDMFVFGQDCMDYLLKQMQSDSVHIFVEYRVDISDLTPIPKQGGTADIILCDDGLLQIIDWKYGKGIQVFAEWNTQLLLYAWGAYNKFKDDYYFETIRMHIAQPRFWHFEFFEITVDDLIVWAADAKRRAYATWGKVTTRSPSPKACQWCKVRPDCAALLAAREAIADQTFDVLDEPMTNEVMAAGKKKAALENVFPERTMPSPQQLSTSDLAGVLKWRSLFEKWFADVSEELKSRALDGQEVPGWKLVNGRSRRHWKEPDKVAERLALIVDEEELYQRKLISPHKMEAVLRAYGVKGKALKDYLRLFTEQPPGQPTLAPAGDNRLAIPVMADDIFEVEDDEL